MAHYALIFNKPADQPRWEVVTTFDDARPADSFRDLYEAGQIFVAPAEVVAGWVYEHGASPPAWYPPQTNRVITGQEFLGRFLETEVNDALSKDVAGALLLLSTRNTVDLNEQGDMLDDLVSAGTITTQRKAGILA